MLRSERKKVKCELEKASEKINASAEFGFGLFSARFRFNTRKCFVLVCLKKDEKQIPFALSVSR